jgi:hypothetical protein
MDFNMGMTRESNRRAAVRRITKDFDNDEQEKAAITTAGIVARSSEVT